MCIRDSAYNTYGIFSEEEQKGAWYTLYKTLEVILKLLAPITPFITDAIWRELFTKESIHKQRLPEPDPRWDTKYKELKDEFMSFNTTIWRYKKQQGLALSSQLNCIVYAPEKLKPLEKDLKAMHRIKALLFTKPPSNAEEIGPGIYIVRET